MGIALPLYGYALPRGRRYLLKDPDSAWNRQAHESIREFGRALGQLVPKLKDFIYPKEHARFPADLLVEVVQETDALVRPELHRLLEELKRAGPGSIVVPNLSHLRMSDEHCTVGHRALLTEIIDRMVPVFTTQVGSGRTLLDEIRRDETRAYFTLSDNYLENCKTLQKHLAQFPIVQSR